MTQVIPAVIAYSREELEAKIKKVSGFADLVQIDIADGSFAKPPTFPYNNKDSEFFEALKNQESGLPLWEDVNFEIHLMVNKPEEVVLDWINAGATTIIAQIEATENFQKVIDICTENAVSVGIAIKPSTDLEKIEPFISQVEFVQCMGSDKLGSYGVSLENKALDQIKKLHGLHPDSIIAVDIGVNLDTKAELVSAGVKKLVSGGLIMNSPNPKEVFEELSA